MNNEKYKEAASLLSHQNILWKKAQQNTVEVYLQLIRQWNQYARLVSANDLEKLDEHVVDSISLCPYIREAAESGGLFLDIGSGGGFPAIPIKIALPDLQVALIERSERKVGFLIKITGELQLKNIKVYHADFPHLPQMPPPKAITARAVNKAQQIITSILHYLPAGSVYLCQGPITQPLDAQKFHVEHIVDGWSQKHLRRGLLYRVQRTN